MSEVRKAGSEEFKQKLSDAQNDPNFAARTKLSDDPEKAAERAAKAKGGQFDVSGYSDREISMALQGDSFLEEDYARLTGKAPGKPSSNPAESKPSAPSAPSPDRSVEVNPAPTPTPPAEDVDKPVFVPTPVIGDTPKDFLGQYITNSFNAHGGTLTNTGDITAGRDIKLDNSVTNSNTANQVAADGYRLNLGDLKL